MTNAVLIDKKNEQESSSFKRGSKPGLKIFADQQESESGLIFAVNKSTRKELEMLPFFEKLITMRYISHFFLVAYLLISCIFSIEFTRRDGEGNCTADFTQLLHVRMSIRSDQVPTWWRTLCWLTRRTSKRPLLSSEEVNQAGSSLLINKNLKVASFLLWTSQLERSWKCYLFFEKLITVRYISPFFFFFFVAYLLISCIFSIEFTKRDGEGNCTAEWRCHTEDIQQAENALLVNKKNVKEYSFLLELMKLHWF